MNCSLLCQLKNYTILCFFCLGVFNPILAKDSPLAILGGQGDAPYAAFLQEDGSIVELTGLPATGLTFRVAINASSYGIIGGTDGLNAYAALVPPSGTVMPVAGLMAPGEIYTVAINGPGHGIIGGGHATTNVPYAALVSNSGIATSLSLPATGLIYSVAIDSSGEGVIGGIGPLNSAYASIVSPTGTVTPIAGLPTMGSIFWVAVNDSKMRFIGGQENASIYAAFVAPNGALMPVAGLPLGTNYSVALNASGNAIMGGTSLTLPYAALVNRNGSVTTLSGLPTTTGIIYNVAINDSGTGLIAGFSTTGPYGSLVAPDGSLTPLTGLPTGNGFLDGAALHSSGVGIVGGTSSNAPFAALVAPNGTLTYLSGLPASGQINSIAIASLDNLVPKSIGPFDSWANTQFALSDTLTQHCISTIGQPLCPLSCCDANTENASLWFATFGNYVQEKSHHAIPAFSNKIAGAVLGLDYLGIQDMVVGGGLAYAYNSVHYSKSAGNASINQESAVLYATLNKPRFYLNMALWAGTFQATNKRRSLGFITSTAQPWGWNLSPHLELGVPFLMVGCQGFVIDPFIALDWAHNWQSHFREKGRSGFNIQLKNQHLSIFRSELGLRFYETFSCKWGYLILAEKISYVNRTAIQKGKGNATFIGATSSFAVETLDSRGQNQGNIQIQLECLPSTLKNIYTSFDYQGSFGSALQSHMLTFMVSKKF